MQVSKNECGWDSCLFQTFYGEGPWRAMTEGASHIDNHVYNLHSYTGKLKEQRNHIHLLLYSGYFASFLKFLLQCKETKIGTQSWCFVGEFKKDLFICAHTEGLGSPPKDWAWVYISVLSQNKRYQAWLGISIIDFTYGLVAEGVALNRYKEKGHCLLYNLSSFMPHPLNGLIHSLSLCEISHSSPSPSSVLNVLRSPWS